jgi:uncharacterized protein YndB with AHSA1/START domain
MSSNTLNRRGFIGGLATATALATAALTLPSTIHAQGKVKPMKSDNLTGKARIRIRRPPSDVFAAFADASAMSKFWFTRQDDGLREGESVSWFIGSGENAVSFDIRVKELKRPSKIVIEWENGGEYTQVAWSIEGTVEGDTILTIEESGFTGSRQSIIERAMDSTAGFNQVIIAAKAFIEHGIELNVVADHA